MAMVQFRWRVLKQMGETISRKLGFTTQESNAD